MVVLSFNLYSKQKYTAVMRQHILVQQLVPKLYHDSILSITEMSFYHSLVSSFLGEELSPLESIRVVGCKKQKQTLAVSCKKALYWRDIRAHKTKGRLEEWGWATGKICSQDGISVAVWFMFRCSDCLNCKCFLDLYSFTKDSQP